MEAATSSETTEIEEGIQKIRMEGFLENFMFQTPRGQGGWDLSHVVYQVRSPTYLKNKKKAGSQRALFDFIGLQMVQMPEPIKGDKKQKKKAATLVSEGSSNSIHMARQEWCAVPKEDLENEYLIVNYIVPGSPGVQVVMYFRASEEARDAIRHGQAPPPPIAPHSTEKEEEGGSTKTSPDTDTKADTDTDTQPPPAPLQGWQKTLNRFWQADQDYCDARFKVIPCMDKKAPWAVKMAVGEKPALVGKKLQQYYFRGPNYFEVDMDIASSSTAARILSLVRSLSTSLIVDVGVTIEATSAEELPERMLCQCRLWGLDFASAAPHMPSSHTHRSHTA